MLPIVCQILTIVLTQMFRSLFSMFFQCNDLYRQQFAQNIFKDAAMHAVRDDVDITVTLAFKKVFCTGLLCSNEALVS